MSSRISFKIRVTAISSDQHLEFSSITQDPILKAQLQLFCVEQRQRSGTSEFLTFLNQKMPRDK